MNVESRKHIKPGPVGDQHPLGSALRAAVSGRTDQIPPDIDALLQRLERRRARAA